MKEKSGWKYVITVMVIFLSAHLIPARALAAESGQPADILEMTGEGEVISDVFVREGPSTEYEIIGTVRGGDVVPINGKTKDYWYRIEFEGRSGFVYGDYIKLAEEDAGISRPKENEAESKPGPEENEPGEEPAGEEEPEQTLPQSPEDNKGRVDWEYLKLAAVVVIVAVIMAMIILILRSLLQAGRQDEEEEKKNRSPKKEKKSRAVKKEGQKESGESVPTKAGEAKENGAEEARTIVIREEDYQLHIDPKYFEDEPLAQPDYVTDYLKKKEQENTKTIAKKERTDDLTKAMKKLEELQEEIERLKNK